MEQYTNADPITLVEHAPLHQHNQAWRERLLFVGRNHSSDGGVVRIPDGDFVLLSAHGTTHKSLYEPAFVFGSDNGIGFTSSGHSAQHTEVAARLRFTRRPELDDQYPNGVYDIQYVPDDPTQSPKYCIVASDGYVRCTYDAPPEANGFSVVSYEGSNSADTMGAMFFQWRASGAANAFGKHHRDGHAVDWRFTDTQVDTQNAGFQFFLMRYPELLQQGDIDAETDRAAYAQSQVAAIASSATEMLRDQADALEHVAREDMSAIFDATNEEYAAELARIDAHQQTALDAANVVQGWLDAHHIVALAAGDGGSSSVGDSSSSGFVALLDDDGVTIRDQQVNLPDIVEEIMVVVGAIYGERLDLQGHKAAFDALYSDLSDNTQVSSGGGDEEEEESEEEEEEEESEDDVRVEVEEDESTDATSEEEEEEEVEEKKSGEEEEKEEEEETTWLIVGGIVFVLVFFAGIVTIITSSSSSRK